MAFILYVQHLPFPILCLSFYGYSRVRPYYLCRSDTSSPAWLVILVAP